jgi:WD40 repeat protein
MKSNENWGKFITNFSSKPPAQTSISRLQVKQLRKLFFTKNHVTQTKKVTTERKSGIIFDGFVVIRSKFKCPSMVLSNVLLCCAMLFSCVAWSAPTAQVQPTLQLEVGTHTGAVRRVAFDEIRDVVVTVSDDKTARIWRLSTRQLLHTLRVPAGPGEMGRLYGVAIHPSRDVVAIGGSTLEKTPGTPQAEIYFFHLKTGQLLQKIEVDATEIKRLAWSFDGTLLIAGTAGAKPGVIGFNESGQHVLSHTTQGPVFGLSVARSGMVVATDFSGKLEIFDASKGFLKHTGQVDTGARNPTSVALSPDATQAVVGYFSKQRPTIITLATGQREQVLEPAEATLDKGALMTVAWSPDGTSVYAAGAAALPNRQFGIWRFNPKRGTPQASMVAATDSILDIAVSSERMIFASFDASWGSFRADKLEGRTSTTATDFRGAQKLRADAQGAMVSWITQDDNTGHKMDMVRRVVEKSDSAGLQGAITKRGFLGSSLQTTDQDGRLPYVQLGSKKIDLGDGELAIASSFIMNSDDAVIGTSKALMRLGGDGRTKWRVTPGAEVNAVLSTRGGELVIAALSDGSIRWWNAKDGQLVLSLLANRAGAWVAWTPQGYFDASAGADKLVGWLVNDASGNGSTQFHPLSRFRDRFNRPDIIDQSLKTLDPAAAIAQASPSERDMLPKPSASAGVSEKPIYNFGPDSKNAFVAPPSLTLLSSSSVEGSPDTINIRYAMSSSEKLGKPNVLVRFNGRPANAEVVMPITLDGTTPGQVKVKVPTGGGGVINLVATTLSGNSEPLTIALTDREDKKPASISRPSVDTRPRLFVLAVGVSEYAQTDYRLGLAAKDANDFANVMEKQSGRLYQSVEVRRLLNNEATQKNTLEGLKWLAGIAKTGDVAMLFVAGHGVNVHNGEYYFLPFDGHRDRLAESAVPERAIRDALSQIRGQALFFVDTCHAGNVLGNPRTSARELSRMASELASAENGVVVFASSSGRQDSEESSAWGNGAFTKAVLSGLQGAADLNKSGRVTFKGLDFYVSEEVRRLTSGRQTPVTITPVGVADFSLSQL